jgi:hypothetical protein
LLAELLEANKEQIANEFDYFFLYLHAYFKHCFSFFS